MKWSERRAQKFRSQFQSEIAWTLGEFHAWDRYLWALASAYVARGLDADRFVRDMTVQANEYAPPRLWFALAGFPDEGGISVRLRWLFDVGNAFFDREGKRLPVDRPDRNDHRFSSAINPPIPTWPLNERPH